MEFIDRFMVKWEQFLIKMRPTMEKIRKVYQNVAAKVIYVCKYVMQFKKVFLTVPVAVMSLILALQNLIKLPALVGIGLQGNGEFSIEVIREVAVLGPLAITAICLMLVFISKRTLSPWLVSVLSLVLPLLILFINTFPA